MIDFDKIKIKPEDVKNSTKWFNDQVQSLTRMNIRQNGLMKSDAVRLDSRVVPGKMYFFFYDPKTKDTLPHYDIFPLVLPYAKTKDGFMGLNLHYLDYQPRMMLFKELLKISGDKSITETSKLRYSWSLIEGMSKMRAAHPCLKHYLTGHVRSPYAEVKTEFWHTAIMLPVQKFVGENAKKIWTENRKYR